MNKKEFHKRRTQFMRMIGRSAIAVVPSAKLQIRNRDAEHPFRQDSDFQYLTGFHEPESVAVFVPGRKHGQYILFCREKDPEQEVWTGPRAGQEGARDEFGADDSFPIGDIDEILPGLLEDREKIYYTMGRDSEFDQHVFNWVKQLRDKSRAGARAPEEFVSLDHILHDMRLYKSRSELSAMRKAAKITVEAHKRAMQATRPGVSEFQIEAEILHTFRYHGAVPAYQSIIGGGKNGCVLHYVDNSEALKDGDLLLIDAGAEYDYYAADVTRTFPVNGRFNTAQRALYDVVLAAQKAAIAKVRAGNHWNDPHNAAVKTITEGLVKLGLLKGRLDNLIKTQAYKRFYMHRTGHWLGMDVHDVGDYKVGKQWRILERGMVLTIEPGIYIPANSKGVAKKWWNIGIRIEDDVLVTDGDAEVLTKHAPSEVEQIEQWMASSG